MCLTKNSILFSSHPFCACKYIKSLYVCICPTFNLFFAAPPQTERVRTRKNKKSLLCHARALAYNHLNRVY